MTNIEVTFNDENKINVDRYIYNSHGKHLSLRIYNDDTDPDKIYKMGDAIQSYDCLKMTIKTNLEGGKVIEKRLVGYRLIGCDVIIEEGCKQSKWLELNYEKIRR